MTCTTAIAEYGNSFLLSASARDIFPKFTLQQASEQLKSDRADIGAIASAANEAERQLGN